MTWIYDDNGKRWVDPAPRKQRKPARALRFANLKVGDQLVRKPDGTFFRKVPVYYVVTDLWFDPVEGQDDPVRGSMVGFCQIKSDGSLWRKRSTTLRGLASQQYHYADIDYIAFCVARAEEMKVGNIVGIGRAHAIRARPKIAGL